MRLFYPLIAAAMMASAGPALAQNAAAPPSNTAANTVTMTDVNATTTTADANVAMPVEAAPAPPTTTTETTTASTIQQPEKKFPWGVIGLIGLIGLLGLRRRS